MKTMLCFAAFGLAVSGFTAYGQTIVNITAPDSAAAETWPGQAPNPAAVRITRTGSTANALSVWVKSKRHRRPQLGLYRFRQLSSAVTGP